ncbi:MAG TPA: hypothetical protein DCG19_07590 [Cryomorphaceae bacterium]|nr:hypothetical protein [Owenweeksia sp.]MBF99734.1 hypothetical protein [Owenweeksia sp.]HAD97255.1 hypothetical protein [Cryomorphaceae bacterium]HBF21644.1 hypothetical protein [Cryomorphaceae bacterium]HCQ16925.1 hypothetical protein [Cryomorphaceae bacterium]|tara:strand:+ start:505 stop:1035 length:531 start_codon:yes stop_codon:yes gene_type:complete
MSLPLVKHYCDILEITPSMLNTWLIEMPDDVIRQNEGGDTWRPIDIVGHLIHNEETDWLPRIQIIMGSGEDKNFEPFDRMAQFQRFKGFSLVELLNMFSSLRFRNVREIRKLNLTERDLEQEGIHPAFGRVTLRQLLAAYVVHDQTHIYQIARCVSYPLRDEVGPWNDYLKILNQN